jgi:hypothetical protein
MKEKLINALIDEIRRYGRVEIASDGDWAIWIDYPQEWGTQKARIAHGTRFSSGMLEELAYRMEEETR